MLTKLDSIIQSTGNVLPELILSIGILLTIIAGLIFRNKNSAAFVGMALLLLVASLTSTLINWDFSTAPSILFEGMLRNDTYTSFFKILFDASGILTVLMSVSNSELRETKFKSEYYALILSAVLGAHLLAMSMNLIMIFLSLELLSISSYVLVGFSFTNKGAEGSLKYFLFGSTASAVMIYGMSILFGLTGTLEFSSENFITAISNNQTPLLLVAGLFTLAGFLYKVSAVPMHIWAPDVYEASPMPVLAFLSSVPKLAGLAVLSKFILAVNLANPSIYDWQIILCLVVMLTILVGNFSALWQTNPKRLMAYSSIAQSGFLLVGVVCFSQQGLQFMLFYATIYVLANFAVLMSLQTFERQGLDTIASFSGWGKSTAFLCIVLLVGMISLAGIPPTAGFTSKLFIFTALWDAYQQTDKALLLWLLIFGLLNTVVSLFYYLKIPYYAFLKNASSSPIEIAQKSAWENYLAFILVLVVLFLFIQPGLLMGWLNKINFVV